MVGRAKGAGGIVKNGVYTSALTAHRRAFVGIFWFSRKSRSNMTKHNIHRSVVYVLSNRTGRQVKEVADLVADTHGGWPLRAT